MARVWHVCTSWLAVVTCASAFFCDRVAAQSAELPGSGEQRWQLALHSGFGTYESVLPSVRGDQRVARSPFAAAGFSLAGQLVRTEALRIGAGVDYASSIGFEISRPIFEATSEQSAARIQELRGEATAELALREAAIPIAFPFALGYGLFQLTTDTRLVVPGAYAWTGPYAQAGVRADVLDERLALAALGEAGVISTTSEALDRAGASGVGSSYAFIVSAALHLTPMWQLGLRLREAHASLPLRDAGSFAQAHRLILLSVVVHE